MSKAHSPEEAQRELGIGKSTLRHWKNQQATIGSLDRKMLERMPNKYHSESSKTFIKKNPFATLEQIAAEFGDSKHVAFHALKRLKNARNGDCMFVPGLIEPAR